MRRWHWKKAPPRARRNWTVRSYFGKPKAPASWVAPPTSGQPGSRRSSPGFAATELIPSWVAKTPGRSWIRVDLRGTTATGASTGWDTISRWALRDTYVQRTSLGKQPNGGAHVAYDTWVIPKGVTKWQLRVVLFRKAGSANAPSIDQIGAIASKSATTVATTSKPTGLAAGKVLDVPKYSQMTHTGRYPQYGGGGVAWCSPTSVSMVLGYYQALPKPAAYAWVNGNGATRFVDHAARMTYDAGLRGTGNWPFNTAYAASLTGKAFVTRLPNLRAAERRIAAGTPLVVSIAFSRGQLKGAPIGSTSGHLLVIVGFTKSGDVVVNDPAAPKASGVRRTYDRAQFEAAWQRRSGGLTYVITK